MKFSDCMEVSELHTFTCMATQMGCGRATHSCGLELGFCFLLQVASSINFAEPQDLMSICSSGCRERWLMNHCSRTRECRRQQGGGCWQKGSAHLFCSSGSLSAVNSSPQNADGLVSMASAEIHTSTEMGAWFEEVGCRDRVSFSSFWGLGKGQLPWAIPLYYPWYLFDTPNCWAGNQNKWWQLHKQNNVSY